MKSMNVSVTEALRIKNQLACQVNAIRMQSSNIQYGESQENGKEGDVKVGEQTGLKFNDYMVTLMEILDYSHRINSILAKFSVESGIADAVRLKANSEIILHDYETAMERSTSKKSVRHEIIGTVRTPITSVFVPYNTKVFLKGQIKIVKETIRKCQSLIDQKNGQSIELPFDYDDIEALSSITANVDVVDNSGSME